MNFRLYLIGFKEITAVIIMTVFYEMCHILTCAIKWNTFVYGYSIYNELNSRLLIAFQKLLFKILLFSGVL